MKLKRTGSRWDRSQRININDNWDQIERENSRLSGIGKDAENTLKEAIRINAEAQRTNNMNKAVDERLDNIIADSGTSSTEVVDARGSHTVLGGRLDAYGADIEYLNYRPVLSDGTVSLPEDFPVHDLNVQRLGKFNYAHNHTPYKDYDWSEASHIYISSDVSGSYDGKDPNNPISLGRFRANYIDGVYGNEDLVINLIDNILFTGGAGFVGMGFENNNVLFRSRSNSGKTWLGAQKREGIERTRWINSNGIFSTTMTWGTTDNIEIVLNISETDAFGSPSTYVKVSSLALCVAEKGTFYQNGDTVYCNPFAGENIHRINPLVNTNNVNFNNYGKRLFFENIGFIGNVSGFLGYSLDSFFRFYHCVFYRSTTNAISIQGVYDVRSYDCTASYGTADGFNYHTTNPDSIAVEVNCFGYWNGLGYKIGDRHTNSTSNNGSTAHDGMYMLRIGSQYWKNQGPVVADVNDCYSISIGCKVGDNQSGNTGDKIGFWLHDGNKPKYVIEAEVVGDSLGVSVHSNVPEFVYLMDINGKPISTATKNGGVNWIDGSDF